MTFVLLLGSRVLARGSWSAVLDVGEERGLVRRDTLGHATAEPVHVPRLTDRAARVVLAPSQAGARP